MSYRQLVDSWVGADKVKIELTKLVQEFDLLNYDSLVENESVFTLNNRRDFTIMLNLRKKDCPQNLICLVTRYCHMDRGVMKTSLAHYEEAVNTLEDKKVSYTPSFYEMNEFFWLVRKFEGVQSVYWSHELCESYGHGFPLQRRSEAFNYGDIEADLFPEYSKVIMQFIRPLLPDQLRTHKLRILDPNSGFGETLMAAASMNVAEYVGINKNLTIAQDGYTEMLRDYFPHFSNKGAYFESFDDMHSKGGYPLEYFDIICAYTEKDLRGINAYIITLLDYMKHISNGGLLILRTNCSDNKPKDKSFCELLEKSVFTDRRLLGRLRLCHKIGMTHYHISSACRIVYVFQKMCGNIRCVESVPIVPEVQFTNHTQQENNKKNNDNVTATGKLDTAFEDITESFSYLGV